MKNIRIRVRTLEEMLGTASADKNIHAEFIASKAPDARTMEEEIEAVGADEVFEKAMTVFPRVNGQPVVWDYQWKGFFKDACGMLRKVPGSACGKVKAYKKEIDGLIFVHPRAIPVVFDGEVQLCQRPLRGQTAQGERIALATSEAIPAGAEMEFVVQLLCDEHQKMVLEMMEYGKLRGFGQWRNSGKGRFEYEVISVE